MSLAEYYRHPDQYLNVLYFDDDPEVAAKCHCDKHLGRMLIDACKILSTVWCSQPLDEAQTFSVLDWGPPQGEAPPGEVKFLNSTLGGQRVYRPAHTNHPCVTWAALYGGNYDWLYRLGMALAAEHEYRLGRIHACVPVIRALEVMPPALRETIGTWCDAPAVVPSEFLSDAVNQSYKTYYRKEKLGLLQYTKREPPVWLANAIKITEYEE